MEKSQRLLQKSLYNQVKQIKAEGRASLVEERDGVSR